MAGVLQRVDIIAEEAGRLSLGEELSDRCDGGVDPGAVAVGAEEEPRQLVPLGEKVELAAEESAEALDRGEPDERDAGQGGRELGGRGVERRLVEPGLGREVVVEQLFVDSRSPGDRLGAGAREAVARELVPGRGKEQVGGRRLAAGQ